MKISEIRDLINEFGISHRAIAKKMNMNENTFRQKLNEDGIEGGKYRFLIGMSGGKMVNEIDQLRNVIADLINKANKVIENKVLVEMMEV